MGSLNNKASGAQCFIMALGLFWDEETGLPWTPTGVGSLEPRGYCIFLPGAHYLTINSPYGSDSSLNKLLLLLLLLEYLSSDNGFPEPNILGCCCPFETLVVCSLILHIWLHTSVWILDSILSVRIINLVYFSDMTDNISSSTGLERTQITPPHVYSSTSILWMIVQ